MRIEKTGKREYELVNAKVLEIGKVRIEVGNLVDEQHKDGGPLWYNIFIREILGLSGGTELSTPEEILENYIYNGGDITE